MPNQTLLDVLRQRFNAVIDADSDAGQILGSLIPRPPFDDNALTGQADLATLTFVPTSGGVSVRAAQGADAVVFSVPAGPIEFTIVPPDNTHLASVELKLLALTVPLPFLRAAQLKPDGTLQATAGNVALHLPDLLLIVTAGAGPAGAATARLAPAEHAGALLVTMTPPFALIGPGTTLGFGFEQASLKLDGPGEPEITAPDAEIFVAPPGVPALAMRGGAHDLRIGLGTSAGVSGDFTLTSAGGPGAAGRPDFLQALACRVRLNRNAVTLLEITGRIDVKGAAERRLGGTLDDPPGSGTVNFTLSLTLNGGWRVALTLAADGGKNYLWRTQRTNPGGVDLPRDTLGAYAVFAPLLVPNLPGAGASGYVDLALGAGAAGALVAAGLVHTMSVTVFGGELIIRQPATGEPEGFLFFDVETELHVTAKVAGATLLASRRPLKVRHQAIGIRLDFGSNSGSPRLQPVFDPAKGFSLDLSDPGMFEVPGPLGDIVQPRGARMARQNPLMFEVDLELKADLGVVTVDRTSVRIPIDSGDPPKLTALGGHLDVPGALAGSGYLKLENGGFAGSLDASVTPLGVRVAAGLALQNAVDAQTQESVAAVLATLGVELPVPIPLANSGLGLFGFLGLFAMHFERNQAPTETALGWFVNQAQGDATKLAAWRAQARQWAFGLGTVLGTIEGGFLVHAKGMVVIELPGPKLLLVMNADILSPRPGTRGTDTGTFLAVIELSPDSLTIGIVVEYKIKPLLEVRVPVEAFFDFKQLSNWHLDIGAIPPKTPASIKFLFNLRADGYLMIHGNGICDFPLRPLRGFSVAAGVRAALTWGLEDIGLYLKIAAQADVGISFKPFLIVGKMKVSGELHLFIIGIEASASADVLITDNDFYVYAEVCGKVDFFFFDVEGCVALELGSKPKQLPEPEPMVRAMSLHSRSPALVPGTGTDRPVDGSLGDAAHLDEQNHLVGTPPVVPIDAIPVLQFEMRPYVDPACKPFGQPLAPKLPADGWARRGERFYRYTLKSLALTATNAAGAPLDPPFDEGDTPCVWWGRTGKPTGGEDNDVQLALLNWIPDPTPVAAERTTSLDQRVTRRWADICAEVAGPVGVLWTFRPKPSGPSPSGWTLTGMPWPDEAGTVRSTPPAVTLRVTEPWRSRNAIVDALRQVDPAIVFASPAVPDRVMVGPLTGPKPRPLLEDDRLVGILDALGAPSLNGLADALRLDAGGLTHARVLLFVHWRVWETGKLRLRSLDADGNDTGLDLPIDAQNTRQVHTLSDLPGEWNDPASPWAVPVQEMIDAWYHVYVGPFYEPPLLLVDVALPTGTAQIEIGADGEVGLLERYWGILAVEGATTAEEFRYSYDKQQRQAEIDVVNGALGADQGKRALLRTGATYTVTAAYDVAVADVDDQGAPKPSGQVQGLQQRFVFKTDDRPPERLDPWILTTSPEPFQEFFFWGDPIRVVFATNAVRKLFKAYGQKLFAVVRAASGHHPPPSPHFDPARVRLDETVVGAAAIPASAMTPWESALRVAVADQPCLTITGPSARQERITLTMDLEPLTDYILDIEGEPSTNDRMHPLFRRHFSTSRYQNARALATAIAQAKVRHCRVADGSALIKLGDQHPGLAVQVPNLEIEQCLRRVRWGDLTRPDQPRVTLIWQDGAGGIPPQPVALLLETTEPLWRWRQVPEEVTDQAGTRRWQLRPKPWLDVIEPSGAASVVTRFVSSAGGGRTLALLRPGARGGTLNLALRQTHHDLFDGDHAVETTKLATASLAMAPWEAEA